MESRFDVGLEADSRLDTIVSLVYDYWGIDQPDSATEIEEEELKYRTSLAEATVNLMKAATRLQQPRQMGNIKEVINDFREGGYDLTQDPLVRDFAELEVMKDLYGIVGKMADRALRLLDYLCTVEGEVTQDYLLRVARCYVFGMHPETVVMCGAVLEAALDRLLPSDDKRRTLGQKISELEGDELKGNALEGAREINRLRTDAVHLRLERLPPDSIDVIELLDQVLSQLD